MTLCAVITTVILLIFMANEASARGFKMHVSGSMVGHGIRNFINTDLQDSSIYSGNQFQCTGNNTEAPDDFICEGSDINRLNQLATEIQNTPVNKYSQWSVDNYNSMVGGYNNELQKSCVSLMEYCKPYNCNAKFLGTVYQKSTDTCVCENGITWTTEDNCRPASTNSDISESTDTTGSDGIGPFGWLVVAIIGYGIWSWATDRTKDK